MIHVVAGVIWNANREILIAERPPGRPSAGLWEFPGGKLEKDEEPLAALKRELDEEIGIAVTRASPFMQLQHDYTDRVILLDVWQVYAFDGEPTGREGQLLRWVSITELTQYQFPAANEAIVNALMLLPNLSLNDTVS